MKSHYFWIGLVVVLSFISGCQTSEEDPFKTKPETFLTEEQMEKMIKLGRKLENPYSVENMKRAWTNLTATNVNARTFSEDLEITTTHFYVKFNPKTESELSILKLDSTLILFDYPLDVELHEGGQFYHDPSLPLERPTYQYASVPVDFKFPKVVEYEILADLFIPDEYDQSSNNMFVRATSFATIEALVDEAFRITGNSSESSRITSCSVFYPSGTLSVWDPGLNKYVPVHDVEVRANRWFTTYTDKSNSQGYFTMFPHTFTNPCDYSLKWEKYNFELREEGGGTPQDYKNDVCGDWNRDFGKEHKDEMFVKGDHQLYAHVFRAARHYYYGDNKGLRRPPENGVLSSKLQIKVLNKADPDGEWGNHNPLRRYLGGVDIKIYNDRRKSHEIYGTTIHELAHASHWNMDTFHYNRMADCEDNFLGLYCSASRAVMETWAVGVEWELTRMFYPNFVGNTTSDPVYTHLVIDMIDETSNPDPFNLGLKIDNVTGYSIREIEDALKGKSNWSEWEQSITNKYENDTENMLDELFAYWKNKWN